MRRFRLLGLVASLVVVLTNARAQSPADPAEWAPAEALFFLGVTDTAQVWTDFTHTSMYTLLQDSDAQTMYGPVKEFANKIKQRIATLLEVSPEQLENPFAGPAALFVHTPSGKADEASPAIILNVGKRDAMQKYYAAAIKHMREAAANYEAVSAGSYKIDVFTGKGDKAEKPTGNKGPSAQDMDDEPDDEPDVQGMLENPEAWLDKLFSPESMPKNFALCLADERLIAAKTADEVRALLKQGDKSKSLAGSDDYRSAQRLFKQFGPVRMLVNLPRIIELSKSEGADHDRMLSALGTKSMRSIVGHAQVAGSNFDSRAEIALLTNGEPTGLMRILSMKNGPVAPRDSVPNTASMLLSLHIDPTTLADEIEKMVRQFDPDAADQMRAGMESVPTTSGETVNVRKDLIENLRPPLTLFVAFTKPFGPQSTRFMASIGLRTREAVEKFIGLMAPPGMLVPRDVRGTQVFDSPMGGATIAPAADALYVGSTPAVEAALQGGSADSLASDPQFRRAAQAVAQEAWFTFYIDSRKVMEAAVGLAEHRDELQASISSNFANAIAFGMASAFAPKANFKPENFQKLLKYYAPAIMTISSSPEALRLNYVQLKPETN